MIGNNRIKPLQWMVTPGLLAVYSGLYVKKVLSDVLCPCYGVSNQIVN